MTSHLQSHDLRRINEKGVPGIWVCEDCGQEGSFKTLGKVECLGDKPSNEEALLRALGGQEGRIPTKSDVMNTLRSEVRELREDCERFRSFFWDDDHETMPEDIHAALHRAMNRLTASNEDLLAHTPKGEGE